jgi:hypothetical protein
MTGGEIAVGAVENIERSFAVNSSQVGTGFIRPRDGKPLRHGCFSYGGLEEPLAASRRRER